MGDFVRYNKIIGTGGIGVGMLFHSEKTETLGRNESRQVTLSKAKDFCKQHIVLYYPATLAQSAARVIPIGFVGDDPSGHDLIAEMAREGMDVTYVGVSADDATMISVCLQYPDKEGCNITATNNAARHVTQQYVRNCLDQIAIDQNSIVAALPEVPAESRMEMIKAGKEKKAFTVLSIPAAEAGTFLRSGILAFCDLLAVNAEEACAMLGKSLSGNELMYQLQKLICELNPAIRLLVTCGKSGAYTSENGSVRYLPPLPVTAVNTAGAGDAFLGGMLAGLAKGLLFQKNRSDSRFGESKLESAAELGALCAGMSVETEDSIAFSVTPDSIRKKITDSGWEAEPCFIS